jgi:hypothetical protein
MNILLRHPIIRFMVWIICINIIRAASTLKQPLLLVIPILVAFYMIVWDYPYKQVPPNNEGD